ncbi:MAG: TetR/AcrR family transcriptional regulator [Eubacteriales bacterium]
MKEKLTKRKLQAAETRQKIYDAAKALMEKNGHEAVGIDDIVREAGVARGTFYVYFLSKEDLLVYIVLEGAEKMRSQITGVWDSLDKSLPASDLIVAIACYICELTQSAGAEIMRTVYKIFIERRQASGVASEFSFDMPDLFINLYNLGVSRGEFIPANASEIAASIKTILVGLTFEWCLYDPNYSFIERAKALVSEYLNRFKL